MDPSAGIPPKYKSDVQTIAEMLGISHDIAFVCLKNANYSKERAIQKLINPQFTQINYYSQVARPSAPGINVNMAINVQQEQEVEQIPMFQSSRKAQFHSGGFRMKRLDEFKKTYLIKKKQKPRKTINRRKQKGKTTPDNTQSPQKMVEQFIFLEQLQKLLQNQAGITFKSDLFDVFKEMHQQKKLVALHNIKFTAQDDKSKQDLSVLQEYIKSLYRIPEFVIAMNCNFINYGLDSSKFDYQHYPYMKNFITPAADDFTIVVLRFNQGDNTVSVVRKWRINFIFKLSEKEKFNSVIKEAVSENNRFNYFGSVGVKPLTEFEKRKIEEDRQIRQQQQKQYLQNITFKETLQRQQQMQVKKEVQLKETAETKREKIRQNLQKYTVQQLDNPIRFKIRLPSGQFISLALPRNERVEYLFNYIICQDEEKVGFQNPQEFNFDILQPFQRLFLSNRKDEQIGIVFEGSDMETLIVKEN